MTTLYTTLPPNTAMCPVCTGTGRVSVPDLDRRYVNSMAGYNKSTDTLACSNCGGQYMYGSPKGYVHVNQDGIGCTHRYTGSNVGRCLTEYTCSHCNDSYRVDSGD